MHRIEQHINSKWGDFKNNTIFIGCSGGLDSIVLVSIFQKLRFNIKVLHVNYQLRGEDSEKDAKFVEDFCHQNSLPYKIKTIDLGKELESGGNLQELARDVRYDWFKEEQKKVRGAYVAVAHHQNDQIETFFLNLSRKSGVMGLAAMLEEKGRFIRPLLPFSRNELKDYAIAENIKWREDVSNSSNKYRRNFLRNTLLPLLNYYIPSLNESILILVKVMQENQREVERMIARELEKINETKKLKIQTYNRWNDIQKVEFFRQLNQSVALKDELNKLSSAENSKRILLRNHPIFSAIVKQNSDFVFFEKEKNEILPELIIEQVIEVPKSFSKDEVFIDISTIKGELKLRKWKIGDRILPVGMKGSKLISDCIKDAHVPANEKSKVLVVVDDENIHWCVGIIVGRKAIVNKKTLKSDIRKISIKYHLNQTK